LVRTTAFQAVKFGSKPNRAKLKSLLTFLTNLSILKLVKTTLYKKSHDSFLVKVISGYSSAGRTSRLGRGGR
jgi:hypothetical protein